MKILLALILTAFVSVASAQTPVAEMANATLIGPEGITITSISVTNAVLQFGIGTTWCTTVTAPKLPLLVSYVSPNPALCPFDPKPNVAKSIVAQQQTASYNVVYHNAGSTNTVTVTVPALPPPPPPPTVNYKLNCTATAAIPVNAPSGTVIPTTNVVCTLVVP
jgi:hypothetical protein